MVGFGCPKCGHAMQLRTVVMPAAKEHGVKRVRWSFREGVTPEVKIALEAMSKDGMTVVVDGPAINVGGN